MIADLVYLDASAIVKLVRRERESGELVDWVAVRREGVTSGLARIEVHRAVLRLGAVPALLRDVDAVLDTLTLVALDAPILRLAAKLPGPHVRALDAIHLATALSLGDLPDAFLTYDARLATAARRHGLTVVHPGAEELAE